MGFIDDFGDEMSDTMWDVDLGGSIAQGENDWMGDIFGSLTQGGKGVGNILGLLNLFKGRNIRNEVPTLQAMIDAAHASQVYSQAASDPSSEMFKNAAAVWESALRPSAVRGIQQEQLMKDRRRARGGGEIRSEREDEARSAAAAQAFMNIARLSQQQAQQGLQQAATGARGAAGIYGNTVQPFMQYGDVNQMMRRDALSNIGLGMESLGGIFDVISGKKPKTELGKMDYGSDLLTNLAMNFPSR